MESRIKMPLTGEEIVISGISGVFPSSDHVINFKENLYDKVDMVTDEDRLFKHPELPKHSGKISEIDKFDAQFFRVHYKQAIIMDPMTKKLLEHAYGAIYDAGFNPAHLRGNKIGVFVGASFADAEKAVYDEIQRSGFGITGNVKSMHSNRISYWMDAKGPSYSVDMNCASSAAALEHAYRSINTGQCEAAIVGGCNLSLHPMLSISLSRAGFLCADGKTKCFDKNGDGYVRSDAINVLFLQKAKHAKRIYCELYFAKMVYDLKADYEFLPTRPVQNIADFLKGVYSETDVCPEEIEYVEANACGIAQADGNELEAIGQIFKNKNSVKVGSVKSNMGNSEATSGACSLTKLCLAYQEGKIPANIHYYEPQDHINAINDGKIEILQEHSPFNRGYTAINSFSYGGANVHIILKGHHKDKDHEIYKTSLPYLVFASGRQEPGVTKILDILEHQPLDPELIGLLHNIHSDDISGHMCRGFSILTTNEKKETVSLSRSTVYCSGAKRPIWFVYSGMGSQWVGMGAELMRFPCFAAAIERCRKVLLPKGVDIIPIIMEKDETIFQNILHSFVGIAAVQIGLTDMLKEIRIVPDNIIGHSVGELGCAYADGCCSAEEMILCAYYRGLVSIQTPFIRGSMAAVGRSYADIALICPPEIDVACHNSNESCTISGPAEIVKKFVGDLKNQNIFAKEVLCSNIAYHSRYISKAGPALLHRLRELLTKPQMRSKKWVSTSVPIDKWDDEVAKYSSAEYHTNNLLNPVLFEETSKLIPKNALVIEIAPHGLLQAILKRSMSSCLHIPLTRKNHENPVKFFLESIGKLYEAGFNPKISVLYPKIQYPVSTSTALLSHLVDWEHSEVWPQATYRVSERIASISRDFVMTLHDDDYKYFRGYTRNGKNILPESAMLVFVWETFAMSKSIAYKEMSVTFSNIQFYDEVRIIDDVPIRMSINVTKGTNSFQVNCDGRKIITGIINELNNSNIHRPCHNLFIDTDEERFISSKDIYRLLYHKGYSYNTKFQTINRTDCEYKKAFMKWNEDWVSFLDGLLQLHILSRDYAGISVPKMINLLQICVNTQDEAIETSTLFAEVSKNVGVINCGGILLKDLCFTDQIEINDDNYALHSKLFIPHYNHKFLELSELLQTNLQIICNHIYTDAIKVLEICENPTAKISDLIEKILRKNSTELFAVNNFNVERINFHNIELDDNDLLRDVNLLITYNLLNDLEKMDMICKISTMETFILTVEEEVNISQKNAVFTVVTTYYIGSKNYVLLRKKEFSENIIYLSITDSGFKSTLEIIKKIEMSKYVVLVSDNNKNYSLIGMVERLRKTYPHKISLMFIDDCNSLKFDPRHSIFKDQIKKHLALNIFKQGCWGGYYYLPCLNYATPQNIKLNSNMMGELVWVEDERVLPSVHTVKVFYAGISKRDTQIALDDKVKYGIKQYGMDFSGINISNQKVMGLVSGGTTSNVINAEEGFLWPVPNHWSLEDAATVPLPYVLAYYTLIIRGRLQRENRVFVTRGLGSLGQAVIAICLALGCEVFTTVSSQRRKKHLLTLFPKLHENNVMSSRIRSFCDEVIKKTNNERCHIVINSFTGILRQAAVKCVSISGKFLDVSNTDTEDNKPFGMNSLSEEKSYINIDLSQIFKPKCGDEKQIIQRLLATGIAQGYVKPLARVQFSPEKITQAFKYVSNIGNTGRILIKMCDSDSLSLNIQPRICCSAEGSFIVFCGVGDLGIELVDRLVKRGARNLLLIHTWLKISEEYLQIKAVSWKNRGATVKIVASRNYLDNDPLKFLHAAGSLGPVRGIYYIQPLGLNKFCTEKSSTEIFQFLKNLDLASRDLCPNLKEFVVVTRSSSNIYDTYVASALEEICQNRTEVEIPALYFRTAVLDEYANKCFDEGPETEIEAQKISSTLNALEKSLKLGENNVITFSINEDSKNIDVLHEVSEILGYKCIDDISDSVKFGDITTDESVIGQIRLLFKQLYNAYYTMDTTLDMTISDVKYLTNRINLKKSGFRKGLGAFYTYVEENECIGYDPVVPMATLLSNASEREDELYQESAYLMLIPGFEGHHQIFKSICVRLKIHCMTFQISPSLVEESIQQIAEDMFKIMKKRFELRSKFYLMGYSFGVNVALELAAILERSGYVGVVYCLDSSPDVLRIHLDAYLGNLSENEIQNIVLEHMYNIMSGKSNQIKTDLETLQCWSDKVMACLNKLKGLVHYSEEYKRALLESVYRRIMLSLNYKPHFELESQLVLMKGIPHLKSKELPLDYNLSKYTKQPIKVFDLESDHTLAPQDLKVPNIINQFLDRSILERFKQRNLCETYLLDKKKIAL